MPDYRKISKEAGRESVFASGCGFMSGRSRKILSDSGLWSFSSFSGFVCRTPVLFFVEAEERLQNSFEAAGADFNGRGLYGAERMAGQRRDSVKKRRAGSGCFLRVFFDFSYVLFMFYALSKFFCGNENVFYDLLFCNGKPLQCPDPK